MFVVEALCPAVKYAQSRCGQCSRRRENDVVRLHLQRELQRDAVNVLPRLQILDDVHLPCTVEGERADRLQFLRTRIAPDFPGALANETSGLRKVDLFGFEGEPRIVRHRDGLDAVALLLQDQSHTFDRGRYLGINGAAIRTPCDQTDPKSRRRLLDAGEIGWNRPSTRN